jgi:hypothetical protein
VLERRLPPQELGPLRDALSQLQMAYARASQEGAQVAGTPPVGGPQADAAPKGGASQGKPAEAEPESQPEGPGPAESSGRLWVPGR